MFMAGIQWLKTLDVCDTPDFMPFAALHAALRAFKIATGDFVAGMTQFLRTAVCLRSDELIPDSSHTLHDNRCVYQSSCIELFDLVTRIKASALMRDRKASPASNHSGHRYHHSTNDCLRHQPRVPAALLARTPCHAPSFPPVRTAAPFLPDRTALQR